MSTGKAVRVGGKTGALTVTRIMRLSPDPARDISKLMKQESTLVAVFEDGREVPVDRIETVERLDD